MVENSKSIDVQNSNLIQELKKILHDKNLRQPTSDTHIRPVLIVSPYSDLIIRSGNRTTTGSATLYTTPTDKDFYLTSLIFSVAADVNCDSTLPAMQVKIFGSGAYTDILQIAKQTLTATQESVTIDFSIPLRLERNTAVLISHNFTVGNQRIAGCMVGYLI